jgi:hypothetical protein
VLRLAALQLPRILAAAVLALFALLALRRARRGLHPSRVLGLSAIGLLVAAASGGLGFYLAMWAWIWSQSLRPRSPASWLDFRDGLRAIPHLPVGVLWICAWIAWSLAAASLGVALAHRHRLRGFRGAGAAWVAQRWAGRSAWIEIAAGFAGLLLFWRIEGWAQTIVLGEWQKIHEGRSWLEFRAQTTPRPVLASGQLRVRRIELASTWDPSSRALATDREGRLWEASLFGDEDTVAPLDAPVPVRAFHLWAGTPCYFGEERQLQCAWLTRDGRRSPAPLWPGTKVRSFATSRSDPPGRLCAVAEDGEGRCWDSAERPPAAFGSGLRDIDPEFRGEGCAVRVDGSVQCRPPCAPGDERERVSGVERAVSLSANASEACAISEGGTLRCWGNSFTRLGDDGESARRWTSKQILAERHVDQVAMDDTHTCVLSSGEVSCWGDNTWGELCDGTTRSRWWPEAVREREEGARVSDAVSVAVAPRRTCIVRVGGEVACCGIARRY